MLWFGPSSHFPQAFLISPLLMCVPCSPFVLVLVFILGVASRFPLTHDHTEIHLPINSTSLLHYFKTGSTYKTLPDCTVTRSGSNTDFALWCIQSSYSSVCLANFACSSGSSFTPGILSLPWFGMGTAFRQVPHAWHQTTTIRCPVLTVVFAIGGILQLQNGKLFLFKCWKVNQTCR